MDCQLGQLGELPAIARQRLESELGLKAYDADVIVSQGKPLLQYFDATVSGADPSVQQLDSADVLRTLKERDWTVEQFPSPASGWPSCWWLSIVALSTTLAAATCFSICWNRILASSTRWPRWGSSR